MRDGQPGRVLLLTDGASEGEEPIPVATLVKNTGKWIFGCGFGPVVNSFEQELTAIASSPTNIWYSKRPNFIQHVKLALLSVTSQQRFLRQTFIGCCDIIAHGFLCSKQKNQSNLNVTVKCDPIHICMTGHQANCLKHVQKSFTSYIISGYVYF